jgi:LmbE family N-acetylglucosaminyl deacetylase
MTPYAQFVSDLTRLWREGKGLPLGGLPAPPKPKPAPDAPKALIFSPHPDDEVIIGGLPLRLQRELGWNVINVAVTQGSNKARRQERLNELRACCDYIGFGLVQTREHGLEAIQPQTRREHPTEWARAVERIADILREHAPAAVFFPHDDDWNVTHIGTHYLVVDALARLGGALNCFAVETEFWGAMDAPNLMVESSERDVVDLITALSFHVGEVRRNPYHLRMPAWLMDNVRRGGELVGGQGAAAPDFTFATLYRLRRWQDGQFQAVLEKGRFVGQSDDLGALFSERSSKFKAQGSPETHGLAP